MSDFYDLNSPCLSAHLSPEALGVTLPCDILYFMGTCMRRIFM